MKMVRCGKSGLVYVADWIKDLIEMEEWRMHLREYILANLGKIWYVWGGQDLSHQIADCSGLILEVLTLLKRIPPGFKDMNANKMSKTLVDEIDLSEVKCGDLAFYGKNTIHHVMFYLGEVGIRIDPNKTKSLGNHCVAGMCGGGTPNMTIQEAQYKGVALWLRSNYRYRRDFSHFGRVKSEYAISDV